MDGVGGVGWEVYMVRQVKCGWVGGLVYTGGEVIPCGGLLFVYTCVGVFWWGRRPGHRSALAQYFPSSGTR